MVYDSGDYLATLDSALALADWKGFPARRREAKKRGMLRGIGLANYVEGTGIGPFEGVTIRVLPNGKVAVATGATNQGQGTRTTLSQIVAEQIGCRLDDIVMTIGDTGAISQGVGAFASRQAVNAGRGQARKRNQCRPGGLQRRFGRGIARPQGGPVGADNQGMDDRRQQPLQQCSIRIERLDGR